MDLKWGVPDWLRVMAYVTFAPTFTGSGVSVMLPDSDAAASAGAAIEKVETTREKTNMIFRNAAFGREVEVAVTCLPPGLERVELFFKKVDICGYVLEEGKRFVAICQKRAKQWTNDRLPFNCRSSTVDDCRGMRSENCAHRAILIGVVASTLKAAPGGSGTSEGVPCPPGMPSRGIGERETRTPPHTIGRLFVCLSTSLLSFCESRELQAHRARAVRGR